VSDIDTAAVDSLKVLDPKRPIREADICDYFPSRDGPSASFCSAIRRSPMYRLIGRGSRPTQVIHKVSFVRVLTHRAALNSFPQRSRSTKAVAHLQLKNSQLACYNACEFGSR
jgi:hypothetical protein